MEVHQKFLKHFLTDVLQPHGSQAGAAAHDVRWTPGKPKGMSTGSLTEAEFLALPESSGGAADSILQEN